MSQATSTTLRKLQLDEGRERLLIGVRNAARLFAPPPRLTVTEWAERNRMLSSKTASAGPYRVDRAPYQREPQDCFTEPDVVEIVLMWGAQVGKTDGVEGNILGYIIDHDPQGVIFMHPNMEDARDWSRQKLEPMIAESPSLRAKVAPPRSRDKSSTILRKEFPAGFIMAIASNSPRQTRGRSAAVIVEDECDGIKPGPEGDPGELLWRRARTFPKKKRIRTSTPTIKGHSRIEAAFEASDKRYFWVPCPHCSAMQKMVWAQVKFKNETGDLDPDVARYECEHCGGKIEDRHKLEMLQGGEWRAEAPFVGIAGFHLNAIYSPWTTFRELAQNFIRAKRNHDLQSFINTDLAETWEEDGESLVKDDISKRARLDPWSKRLPEGAELPDEVAVLTIAIDAQESPPRLEYEVAGWGAGEERWSILYGRIFGHVEHDPGVLRELDAILNRPFWHAKGIPLYIRAGCFDTGWATQTIYRYCRPRFRRPLPDGFSQFLFAIKGRSEASGVRRPIWPTASGKSKKLPRLNLWTIGVDAAKDRVHARLRISDPGPGYYHFPDDRDDDYYAGLASEKRELRYHLGRPYFVWRPVRQKQATEPWDLAVYNQVALIGVMSEPFGLNLDREVQRIERLAPKPVPEIRDASAHQAPARPRTRGTRSRGFEA